MTKRLEICKQI